MFRRLITLFVLLVAMSVHAALSTSSVSQAGFDKLTPQEQAEVIKMVTEKAHAKGLSIGDVADPANAERVDQWLNVGERIGKMIGGAAKEVGVAANEFVKTPVGTVAIALIVWHYMGDALLHLFVGMTVMVVGLAATWFVSRRLTDVTRTYSPDKTTWFGRPRLVSVKRSEWTDGNTFVILCMLAVSVLIPALVIVNS